MTLSRSAPYLCCVEDCAKPCGHTTAQEADHLERSLLINLGHTLLVHHRVLCEGGRAHLRMQCRLCSIHVPEVNPELQGMKELPLTGMHVGLSSQMTPSSLSLPTSVWSSAWHEMHQKVPLTCQENSVGR